MLLICKYCQHAVRSALYSKCPKCGTVNALRGVPEYIVSEEELNRMMGLDPKANLAVPTQGRRC
jgi:phage FluMu protein Com